ncbi:nucleoside diphosphate-linked moiety X motif 8 [Bombyx mandarina]|uniref:Nucleoside diphosphate-linked moiety X motif 8 n=1 Tax=Bombyx mandarina TaxID=7092 RepID=A0A6J2JJ93_BOMMA|nr:nucleoside diphosphate-linked moiety X motif 8 [Bombyx mandarina]
MSLSPEVLLNAVTRSICISKLKELPIFLSKEVTYKTKASVLVPLCVENDQVCLLYTLRSSNLSNHSGQVSFPGGKMDKNEDVYETALRETEEEIGISREHIDIWSKMPQVQGRDRNIAITPVIGLLRNYHRDNLRPNLGEVEEIFTVPMKTFCDVNNHAHLEYDGIIIPVFLNEKHKIWGITGMITHLFLSCFLPEKLYNVNFMRRKFTLDELMPSKL